MPMPIDVLIDLNCSAPQCKSHNKTQHRHFRYSNLLYLKSKTLPISYKTIIKFYIEFLSIPIKTTATTMLSRNLFTVVLVPMMFVLAMANLLPINTKVITGNGTEVDGTVVAGIGSDPGQLVVKPPAGFALPTDNITSINGTGVDIVGPAHDNITTALNANESAIVDHQSEEVFTDPSHDQKNDNLNNISKEKELLQPKQLPEADPPVNNCGNGCCVMAYVGTVLLVLNVSVLLGFLLYRGAAYCREEQLHREEQRQRRHRATHPQI